MPVWNPNNSSTMRIARKVDKTAPDVELRYSNWFSQLVNMLQTTFLFVIGGRGTSKSEDILAERTMDIAYEMPGAFVALSADTFMNATKNIVPSIVNGWRRKGWIEGTHFVVDVRPPDHFQLPYKPIFNWKHTITVFTGTHFKIISQDRPSIGAGDSFQHHIGDEAKYLNDKKLNKVNPAIRGEFVRFGHSPFYGGLTFTTDMPDPNQGDYDWILRMADNMDKEKIRYLFQLAVEVNKKRALMVRRSHFCKAHPQDKTAKVKLLRVEKSLKVWEERFRKFRMNTTFFYVVSSFVNADILTEGYFKKLLETMDFKEFMVAILSLVPKLDQGVMFYPNLTPGNFYLDGFNYSNRDKFKSTDDYIESSLDLKYINHNAPIEMGLDTGNMCSLVMGQEQGRVLRLLKEFHTLPPNFLKELGAMVVEYFKYHRLKQIMLWADRAANKGKQVGEDHASKFIHALEYHPDGSPTGWIVTHMTDNQGNIEHQREYELMLDLLSGENPNLPTLLIDRHNCPNVKSSMELAKKIIKVDRYGNKTIHKDKSSEKLPLAQLPKDSTNYSDAVKYFCCRQNYLDHTKGRVTRYEDPGTY